MTLDALAAKYLWWHPSASGVPVDELIVQVMNTGDYDDVFELLRLVGEARFRHVIVHAEAGQFNARSWHYWHYRLGISKYGEVPALPQHRQISAESPAE